MQVSWLRNCIAFKMATYLRVKPTCALILICLQIVYAFGVDRHGRVGHEQEFAGERLYDEVKERVRRGVIPQEEQVQVAGVGAGGVGGGAPPVPGRGGAGLEIPRMQMRGDFQQQVQRGGDNLGLAQGQGLQRGVAPNQMQGQGLQQQGGLRDRGMINKNNFNAGDVNQRANFNMALAQNPGGQPAQMQQGYGQNQNQFQNRQLPPDAPQVQERGVPARPALKGGSRPIRIADEPVCANDVQRLCARKGNNFAVLDCLQKGDSEIAPECNHFLWTYKWNLTMDYRFDNAASEVCRDVMNKFTDCSKLEAGKGKILPCLLDHAEEITNQQCSQYLTRMRQIIFSDYRLIDGFFTQCQSDITKYKCGVVKDSGGGRKDQPSPHSQGGTIHCLEKNVQALAKECKLQILRVAELSSSDYHDDRAIYYACREDRERFCSKEVSGQGRIYKCLKDHKFHAEMSTECKEKLTVRQKVAAVDYKANFRLARKCRAEIEEASCEFTEEKSKEITMATILLCLERQMKEVDLKISGDCQAELTDTRKQILSDYMIDPELITECRDEIENTCKGLRREGKTIHCLMSMAKRDGLSKGCKKALSNLVEEADAGKDYKLDPAVHKACKEVKDRLCADKNDAESLSCLMENIEHATMKDDCADRLVEIQYFISRNFRLDAVLFKNCENDAGDYCYAEKWNGDEAAPSGLVFSCLHNHLHDPDQPLQPRCADQMHRVLRQRAVSVHLNPRIEEECRSDLGKLCNDKTQRGEELRCLQEHLKDLQDKCRLAVGNFTVEEAEDIQMNRKLIASCAPMLRKFCQEKLKAKKVDEGEALKCLIEHKNDDDMEPKCQASIEHFQLIQLKDYRFSYKFKESCRRDVLKLCKGSRDKSSIIKCLSTHVRNSIADNQNPSVSADCRAQLKFELLQRDENIDLDPELASECKNDITHLCSKVNKGNAQMIECLRSHPEDLSDSCHKKLFNREKEMAAKPDIDYALMHACKKTIKTKCKDVAPDALVECLKSHKDDVDIEPRCRTVITKRQMDRNSNIQLNPLLSKSCKMDINKFCKTQLDTVKDDDNPNGEGLVIQCLRKEFQKKESKLTQTCEKHIRGLIKEGAEDYRMDRQLVRHCSQFIQTLCQQEMDEPGSGSVENCLKMKIGQITEPKCQQQVIGLFKEGLADVHVDPLLYKACALDIKHYCGGIPQGQGQQMSCLLEALDEKSVRLQPDCKRMLTERKEMWEYAAQVAPMEGIFDMYLQLKNSPSRNYFMMVFISFIGMLFVFGLCCGRATKRLRHELKSK